MGKRLTVILAAAILTTDGAGGGEPGAGGEPAGGAPAGGAPAGGGEPSGGEPGGEPGGGTPEDLTAIFTAEEIQAQRERVAAAKAEETRRAGLTDEQRDEEDRIKAEADAANKVPEEYADFTAAEGMQLDGEALDKFKPLAKKYGLTQAAAQEFVDLAVGMQVKTLDGLHEIHEQRKATWLTNAKEDEEIGADVKLWNPEDPKSAGASVALRAFNTIAAGNPGIKAMVDEFGIGNHPDFIRVFYRIGLRMREDSFEGAGGGGGGSKGVAKSLWPDMN